ncbi:MAG: hypothetical protein LUE24_13950 [Lachnospiraceae bacterium]|nr:hypothetical protein [Lachnospiraceae bacterium]
MLNQIKEALQEAFPDLPVFYGSASKATGKKIYDYLVFWRERAAWKPGSRGDPAMHYTVAYVRQDFIPEDDETKVRDALDAITGLKATDEVSFDYLTQPGTSLALEVAEYHFVAPRKRLTPPAKEEG